jgi:hypothetical protein
VDNLDETLIISLFTSIGTLCKDINLRDIPNAREGGGGGEEEGGEVGGASMKVRGYIGQVKQYSTTHMYACIVLIY